MGISIKRKNLKEMMDEKNKHKISNKEELIKNIKDLKKALQYSEELINNDNIKPLEKDLINTLASFPKANCIREALLYRITQKIEKIIEKNQDKFNNDFITEIGDYNITVYCQIEERLNAISFDINEYPPILESIIYDVSTITSEKMNLISAIESLQKEINDEIEESKKAQVEYEQMEKNSENFVKYNDYENFHPSNPYENPCYTSKIEKQQKKLENIWNSICIKNNVINSYKQKITELEHLEKIASKIDLDSFVKLRNELYEELGFNLENESVNNIPMKNPIKGLIKNKTYTIGKYEYSIKYQEKTMKIK